MKEYNETITYRFATMLSKSDQSHLQSELTTVDGIDSCSFSSESVIIKYNTLKLSGEYVKKTIGDIAYPMHEQDRKRTGILNRFIDSLAKSNKNSYGNKKLDCCDLKHSQ